jgi:hypothetical protein
LTTSAAAWSVFQSREWLSDLPTRQHHPRVGPFLHQPVPNQPDSPFLILLHLSRQRQEARVHGQHPNRPLQTIISLCGTSSQTPLLLLRMTSPLQRLWLVLVVGGIPNATKTQFSPIRATMTPACGMIARRSASVKSEALDSACSLHTHRSRVRLNVAQQAFNEHYNTPAYMITLRSMISI